MVHCSAGQGWAGLGWAGLRAPTHTYNEVSARAFPFPFSQQPPSPHTHTCVERCHQNCDAVQCLGMRWGARLWLRIDHMGPVTLREEGEEEGMEG